MPHNMNTLYIAPQIGPRQCFTSDLIALSQDWFEKHTTPVVVQAQALELGALTTELSRYPYRII